MAQDMQPSGKERSTAPANAATPEDDDDGFHQYSGGEVKELAGTPLSPVYLWFIVLLVIGCALYFVFGGTVPTIHAYKPVGGSSDYQSGLRATLAERDAAAGGQISNVDLAQIPLPNGESLEKAIANGSDIYQSYCIGCHGPNQDGNGVNAAGLNPKPRNLRDAPFMQSMSYQRIQQSLHRGVPGTAMPRWENTLSEDQIKDTIAYVWSLTAPKGAAVTTPAGTPPAAPGTNSYVGGTQVNPTPITVPVNGSPTAPQSTAPPSVSGATTHGTTTVNDAPAGGSPAAPASVPTGAGQPAVPAGAAKPAQPLEQTSQPTNKSQKIAPVPGPAPLPTDGGESKGGGMPPASPAKP